MSQIYRPKQEVDPDDLTKDSPKAVLESIEGVNRLKTMISDHTTTRGVDQ